MKIKNLFTILLVLTLVSSTFVIPTSAKNTNNNSKIEIIIYDEVSAETKLKIENYFTNGEPKTDENATGYGLTCTLFGHNLESTTVATINHKVRETSPRCLKKTYDYEACTRCDYEASELIKTQYIVCC